MKKALICFLHPGMPEKPKTININGGGIGRFNYDGIDKTVTLTLPEGKGIVTFK